MPSVLEAALALTLAEAWRRRGDAEHACACIAAAVEDYPGHPGFLALEAAALAGALPPIDWAAVLLPNGRLPFEAIPP